MSGKSFIFLYPQQEIFDYELRGKDNCYVGAYKGALNKCIGLRYRAKGFSINFAILDDCAVSDLILLRDSDHVLRVGMDSVTHRTEVDGRFLYPDSDYVLDQLGDVNRLVVGGFHAYDCCDKLAERAHFRSMDSLIDEELTQFFQLSFMDLDFRYDVYPSVNPGKNMRGDELWEYFLERRRNKPWLIQDFNF
tara:strand:- start:129 stop:704 length:576 start_codon:yes stop_codon:yes gene_type:complete